MNFNAFMGIGAAHFVVARDAEAVDWFEKGLMERPTATWVLRNLLPALALLGRREEAQARKAQLLAEYPDLTVAKIVSALVFSRPTLDRIVEGLRLAGMPEE
jgi:adenylate cyclase